jgi:DNA-binding CsgD family transcriptional regulator
MEMVSTEPQDNGIQREYAFNVICASTEIISCQEFIDCLRRYVVELLPYTAFHCSFGCINGNDLHVLKIVHDHFPLDYFKDLSHSDQSFQSPLVDEWHATRRPVYFQSNRDEAKYPPNWVSLFNKHHLQNILAHGKVDEANGFYSAFTFLGLPGEITEWHTNVMELLVPHLHVALVTALGPLLLAESTRADSRLPFTTAQQHILYWMQQGKTDWETSKILGLSERKVKYHVRQILGKLDATNRTHAVGKALNAGLLSKFG